MPLTALGSKSRWLACACKQRWKRFRKNWNEDRLQLAREQLSQKLCARHHAQVSDDTDSGHQIMKFHPKWEDPLQRQTRSFKTEARTQTRKKGRGSTCLDCWRWDFHHPKLLRQSNGRSHPRCAFHDKKSRCSRPRSLSS